MRVDQLAGAVLAFLMIGTLAAAADVVADIVAPYLRIQTALAGDSIDGLESSASDIVKAAQSLGPAGQAIAEAASRVGAATTLPDARTAFGALSDAFFAYAATAGLELDDSIKVAYCPMVRKSWLQKDGTIANPYYGREMLDCGEFRTLQKPKP